MKKSGLILFYVLILNIANAQKKPNIIIMFCDDLGYGDLGCYGGNTKTPVIDQMVAEGMKMTDFQCPANVCGPSRASLMTGRYPMRNGNPIFQGLDPKEITIPELLKKAGYKTSIIGKWHLGAHLEGSHPLESGFDEALFMEHKKLSLIHI